VAQGPVVSGFDKLLLKYSSAGNVINHIFDIMVKSAAHPSVFNHILRDLADFRGDKLVFPYFPRRFAYTRKFNIFKFVNTNV